MSFKKIADVLDGICEEDGNSARTVHLKELSEKLKVAHNIEEIRRRVHEDVKKAHDDLFECARRIGESDAMRQFAKAVSELT